MIADDLFAGAGGWDIGAQELGIEARGVELMPEARATRQAAGLTTVHDDVWTYKPDGQAQGLIASPPCQTFSTAGKGSGRKALEDVLRGIRDNYVNDLDHLRFLGEEVGDPRTALVLTPLHFALNGSYEWLAWEQVPSVLPVWEACAAALERRGWRVLTGVLCAERYGVPQYRRRAVLLASRRRRQLKPPAPTHSRYYPHAPSKLDPGVAKWISMAEAIGRGLHEPAATISGGGTATGGWEPFANAGYRRRLNESFVDRRTNSKDGRGGMKPTVVVPTTSPSPTLTGGALGQWVIRHPDGDRGLTIREASLLQTFPETHPWQGKKGKQGLQVGNAVPPALARHALAAAAHIKAGATV